jgi:intracellular septation protein
MTKPTLNPALKLALDLGPLLLFFIGNARWGIFVGTGIFVAAVLAALAISYALTRRVSPVTLVTGVMVTIFGGLAIAFQNPTFIKIKPTIAYLLFATALLGGLMFRKLLLAMVLDAVFELDDEGWRKLTLRWALFFVALAGANEIVWRTQSTDFWLGFKAFTVAVTFVFGALQYPLLKRHALPGSTFHEEK